MLPTDFRYTNLRFFFFFYTFFFFFYFSNSTEPRIPKFKLQKWKVSIGHFVELLIDKEKETKEHFISNTSQEQVDTHSSCSQ
ncbi:hypothetical protein EUTSA_v10005215mg [Eutrema salsugineum]|uniref:Uncharacterized protein n=1 Tax=Eutrema salsugineum TaxID=72664 RepID=V4KS72_EUTSA|nr:hypothetical protein EUTSA_v10005215mg [Eutrema salsugineum]